MTKTSENFNADDVTRFIKNEIMASSVRGVYPTDCASG